MCAILQVEVADALGRKEVGKLYVLDPSVAANMREDATPTAQQTSTSAEQERLPLATGKQLQVPPTLFTSPSSHTSHTRQSWPEFSNRTVEWCTPHAMFIVGKLAIC